MKRSTIGYLLLAIAALLLAPCTKAADTYTVVTVTVTNLIDGIKTNGADTLVLNADTRTATNITASNPGKLFLGTNNLTRATTNLYNHIALYSFGSGSTRLSLRWLNTNQFQLSGQINQAVAASVGGVWGFVVSTNYAVTNRTEIVSPASAVSPTTQTNSGNAVADYLNVAQTFLNQTAQALSNYLSLHQHQSASNKLFQASTNRYGAVEYARTVTGSNFAGTNVIFVTFLLQGGSISNLTALEGIVSRLANGYYTNAILDRAFASNLAVRGRAPFSIALGDGVSADGGSGTNSISIGAGTVNDISCTLSVQLGSGQEMVRSPGTIVLGGQSFSNDATNSAGIGPGININHSYAFGLLVNTRAHYEISLGGTSNTVSIIGTNTVAWSFLTNLYAFGGHLSNMVFTALNGTNLTVRDLRATGSNIFELAISKTATNITTLANGVNLVDPGLKTYVKISGPSANYSIDKITRGYDGREIEFQKDDGFALTIVDESGSGGGTAADRVRTGTGGNVTITNNPGSFLVRYDAAAARYVLKWRTN